MTENDQRKVDNLMRMIQENLLKIQKLTVINQMHEEAILKLKTRKEPKVLSPEERQEQSIRDKEDFQKRLKEMDAPAFQKTTLF